MHSLKVEISPNFKQTLNSISCWNNFAKVCNYSTRFSHRYALAKNANTNLENLNKLIKYRSKFLAIISKAGISFDVIKIKNIPIKEWKKLYTKLQLEPQSYSKCEHLLANMQNFGFTKDYSTSNRSKIQFLKDNLLCPLSNQKITELPISDWIELRKQADRKNIFTKFLDHQKLKKQIYLAGLEKPANLNVLESYTELIELINAHQKIQIETNIEQAEMLVELLTKIESIYSDFKGENVFDLWKSSDDEIKDRYNYGLIVYKCMIEASNQTSNPESFKSNIRKILVDERESLDSNDFLEHAKNLSKKYAEIHEIVDSFIELAGDSKIMSQNLLNLPEMLEEIISSAPDLNAWCRWIESCNAAKAAGLKAVVASLESGLINYDETADQFVTALYSWAAPILIDNSDVLRKFSATKHEDLIQQFREMDANWAKITGNYIASKIASGMPDISGPNAPHEYGVLSREIQKKSRHKPVRQLVQELGGHLLNLTPCFMMSPLSVAQYIPSDYNAFDLVIFDEASQIPVWDAVGAIARGKKTIIVGDPKQMPPTNFFNKSQGDFDNEDEADMESILDQGMAAGLTCHRLTGHYRSRHESLIAFSNNQYYDNSLTTYPSADTHDSAVILHRTKGLYSKGKSRNNSIEASALVKEVVRRLKDPELQNRSIGIVTFNSEQQQLVQNLLDDERRNDPSIERFFGDEVAEPIFVKNLETVQGDQRDVICLSVGYGPTEPEAQTMSMNFGPLNKQGGERRLNVAITRAASEMLLFTSFDSTMIDTSRTSARGVKDLKAYIDYATRGPVALAQKAEFENGHDNFDSEFEEAVAIKLREKGWQIRTQIGVSKFRIDLGVLNPDKGGVFLAGIECDGATYHSSPSARDRDRVRHIILENLGWKLIRIWSTDFIINPEKVINQVHMQLKALLEEYNEEQAPSVSEEPNDTKKFYSTEKDDKLFKIKQI